MAENKAVSAKRFDPSDRLADLKQRPGLVFAAAAVIVLIVGAATTPGFTTTDNFKAILASVGILGIVAVGMTLITISGNLFSLSLGITVTMASMTFLAWLDLGIVPAIALTVLLAAAITALQGAVIAVMGANPIVITIAAGSLQLGVAAKLTGVSTVTPDGGGFEWLASNVAGIPVSIFILLGLVIAIDAWLFSSRTGTEIFLSGENSLAARAAALRVTRATVVAFAIAGICAGIAGVLVGATNKNATLIASGTDIYTLNAIAVVLVGGVAVTGGRGMVTQTVLGALFVATISDMLLLRGYGIGIRTLVTGVFVVIAILAVQARGKRAA